MIADGDRIAVGVSGGKDSYALLHLLHASQRRARFDFELIAVHLDQVQPGYDGRPLKRFLEERGYPHRILQQDTYSVVMDKIPEGKTYCSLCSRLRRGILYTTAIEMGCTKIALGHHRDDLLETFLLNLMFAGQLKTMPPKLISDDGRNVVIRPLSYVAEADLIAFSAEQSFPILPCNLCGSQENLRRKAMKAMLTEWEARWPGTRGHMMAALANPRASHLPSTSLWQRLGLPIAETLTPGAAAPVPEAPATISEATIAEELGF